MYAGICSGVQEKVCNNGPAPITCSGKVFFYDLSFNLVQMCCVVVPAFEQCKISNQCASIIWCVSG